MKRVAIIGAGKLGRIVADAIKNGILTDYELVAVMSRRYESSEALCEGTEAQAVESIDGLMNARPDFVVETASVESVKKYCIPSLSGGACFIPLSIGAFADADFYKEVKETAVQYGTKVYIPHGAIGGLDVLHTMALMAEKKGSQATKPAIMTASIETHKGPKSLVGSPVYKAEMETSDEVTAFSGNAKEAIALLPTKVNVAIAASLASGCFEETGAHIVSVRDFVGDDHKIVAETEEQGLKAVLDVYSATAEIAGWSIVALLDNLASPVSFY